MRNIILSRISFVQEQIKSQEDVHILIHEIRKNMKRIRAVLKMIRDEIGYSNYYRENCLYRDLGRGLCGARDSYMLREVFVSLYKQDPDALKTRDYEEVVEHLTRRLDRELSDFTTLKGGFEPLHRELGQAAGRVGQYCRLRNGFVSLKNGVKRIYGRGRRHLARVQEKFCFTEFHEYRKNTKHLLYHIEILRPIYPRVLKSYARSIDRHEELLGEARDYDRLEAYLHHEAGNAIRDTVRSSVLGKIANHREDLLRKIYPESSLIYAEPPAEFVKRLGTYWDAGYDLQT